MVETVSSALSGIPLYFAALLLAFVSVRASVGACMLLAAFYAVSSSVHQLLAPRKV